MGFTKFFVTAIFFLFCTQSQLLANNSKIELRQFKDCDACTEMVVLPSGTYWMGASEEDVKILKNANSSLLGNFLGRIEINSETPRHQVAVKSFAIAKYLVTKAQFSIFARETNYQGKGCNAVHPDGVNRDNEADWQNPWFQQTDSDPVVCVSWDDAQKYISWINSKLPVNHAHYRLPTEAEWEYAARAGTTTPTYWNDLSKQCIFVNARDRASRSVNFSGYKSDAAIADCNDGYPTTSPVGVFPPNPWGLYDMLGNVTQWVSDCGLTNYASGRLSSDCTRKTTRGASWSMVPSSVRASRRSDSPATLRTDALGFRLAIDVN